jgi:hypothetical protein
MLPAAQPPRPVHQAEGGVPWLTLWFRSSRPGVSGTCLRSTRTRRRSTSAPGCTLRPSVRTRIPNRFNTFTADLHRLADWFEQCGVKTVVMESTGVYWIPIYEILEQRGFAVSLANARDARHVPGHKSVTHNGCSAFMSAAEQLPAAGRDRDVAGLSASARAAAG